MISSFSKGENPAILGKFSIILKEVSGRYLKKRRGNETRERGRWRGSETISLVKMRVRVPFLQ